MSSQDKSASEILDVSDRSNAPFINFNPPAEEEEKMLPFLNRLGTKKADLESQGARTDEFVKQARGFNWEKNTNTDQSSLKINLGRGTTYRSKKTIENANLPPEIREDPNEQHFFDGTGHRKISTMRQKTIQHKPSDFTETRRNSHSPIAPISR